MTSIKGLAFPFRFAAAGSAQVVEGKKKVEANLHALALTAINDRVIRSKVGTVGYQSVLRNLGEIEAVIIQDLVREAISKYEPRARILRIKVHAQELRVGVHGFIDIEWFFLETGERDSTTIPIR